MSWWICLQATRSLSILPSLQSFRLLLLDLESLWLHLVFTWGSDSLCCHWCKCAAVDSVKHSHAVNIHCINSPYRNRTCHFLEIINIDGTLSPAMRLCNSFWKRQVHHICLHTFLLQNYLFMKTLEKCRGEQKGTFDPGPLLAVRQGDKPVYVTTYIYCI